MIFHPYTRNDKNEMKIKTIEIHKVSIGNVEQAENDTNRMVQNTQRMELILMFEKNCTVVYFLYTI